jgi:glycosyltransferase involved in cell wall biosynthesis
LATVISNYFFDVSKMSGQGRMSILCFGGEDWWYHNRAHVDMQLMRRFAKTSTTVYINSIVMQKPNLTEGRKFIQKLSRKAKSIFRGLEKSDVGFWVYSPFSLPVHHIFWAKSFNEMLVMRQIRHIEHKLCMRNPIVWVACPVACEIALKLKKKKLVYQRTDRFEEYPNVDPEVISQYDRKLKAHADLTIFVNRMLYEAESGLCNDAIYLDHGVDFDLFASAENSKEVPDKIRNTKRPIVGFFGGIDDHTFDVDFIEEVVDMLPEMSFVFIGRASSDCSGLVSRNNVLMLGQKPYEQIPHYGKCFDVAIMPWRQNRWIGACNPIKLKEYLALGKPVVSTPFTELKRYWDVVYEAETPQKFADCIKRAFAENTPELVAKRRQKVALVSWDSRAQLVWDKLFGGDGDCKDAE